MSPTLPEWVDAVSRELGLDAALDPQEATTVVLELARDVAHGVARPAAPVTAFLLGLAAGRTADTSADLGADLRALAEQIRQLLPEPADGLA